MYIEEMMAKYFAPLVSLVDKYSNKTGGTISFTSVEIKNIQKYCGSWKDSIRTVHERIRQDFKHKSVDVFITVEFEQWDNL